MRFVITCACSWCGPPSSPPLTNYDAVVMVTLLSPPTPPRVLPLGEINFLSGLLNCLLPPLVQLTLLTFAPIRPTSSRTLSIVVARILQRGGGGGGAPGVGCRVDPLDTISVGFPSSLLLLSLDSLFVIKCPRRHGGRLLSVTSTTWNRLFVRPTGTWSHIGSVSARQAAHVAALEI